MNYFKVLLALSMSLIILYSYFQINKKDHISSFNTVQNTNDLSEYFSCPHLTPASYDSSAGINNARIAIVMAIGKVSDYDQFVYAINSTKCYAAHFGYQMEIIELYGNREVEKHCSHTDIFFKRHCALASFMEFNEETIDYVLYLDADMGVVNPCHTIQEYLDKDKRVHLIFYQRFFNAEIAAGSYLVKNSKVTRNLLRFWADYSNRLPKSRHGIDNGALHQVLMELHFNDKKEQMQCYDLWNKSRNNNDLQNFEACVKHALFKSSSLLVNNAVKIICKISRRWVRDAWVTQSKWSPSDFMLHGMKTSLDGERWQRPFVNDFDLNMCQQRSLIFHNFKYFPFLKSTDNEIKKVLLQRVQIVNHKYQNMLQNLNLTEDLSSKTAICV